MDERPSEADAVEAPDANPSAQADTGPAPGGPGGADPLPDERGGGAHPVGDRPTESSVGGATASQLRRFIKSRPWVPMHELRRRFGIEGPEDEMSGVDVPEGRVFVGLPEREASLLGDLIRQGEIGYELIHDPDCPAIAGVYPMRPVSRA